MAERAAGTPSEDTHVRTEREPTPTDAVEIGQAGAAAADPAQHQSPEALKQAVREAMDERAAELQVTVDSSQIAAIADGITAEFERRGAFRKEEPESEEADGEAAESGGEAGSTPPEKRTFAQRFLEG